MSTTRITVTRQQFQYLTILSEVSGFLKRSLAEVASEVKETQARLSGESQYAIHDEPLGQPAREVSKYASKRNSLLVLSATVIGSAAGTDDSLVKAFTAASRGEDVWSLIDTSKADV